MRGDRFGLATEPVALLSNILNPNISNNICYFGLVPTLWMQRSRCPHRKVPRLGKNEDVDSDADKGAFRSIYILAFESTFIRNDQHVT